MFLKILFLNGVLSFGFFGEQVFVWTFGSHTSCFKAKDLWNNVNPYLYKAKIITPCITWNPGMPGLSHRSARAFRPSPVDICTLVIRRQVPVPRGIFGSNSSHEKGGSTSVKYHKNTLQGINISHLGKRKIIFKMPFLGDMFFSLEGTHGMGWRCILDPSTSQVALLDNDNVAFSLVGGETHPMV